MKLTDASWLAGLLDGEGSITLAKPPNINSMRISIANNCMPLLEHVLAVTGTGTIVKKGKPAQANHAQGYYWQCYADNARSLLRQILPWLIVKREKALTVLD